ncbi:hypothetical protein EVAR_36143_1 [Eumeta japonica]|uniref:Uncharacterized protein n=1 Tax=Eumeta variegata TaxID=151549 RepID=A0A4C1X1D4_EUMVA|nr:hypothetical protein EVAR_36143_1 [Eumeta japonica]
MASESPQCKSGVEIKSETTIGIENERNRHREQDRDRDSTTSSLVFMVTVGGLSATISDTFLYVYVPNLRYVWASSGPRGGREARGPGEASAAKVHVCLIASV